jgi:dihydropteroate synthase
MFTLPRGRPAIMGILNVTPDSFSDGGQFLDKDNAVARGLEMAEEGADIIDVGGESTRPGAEPVPSEEELRRILPVIRGLARRGIAISVDTSKASVAKKALEAGAIAVNDVSALRDPKMAKVCADSKCAVCLMHMKGEPRTMQKNPEYRNVVSEVKKFLIQRAEYAQQEGISKKNIWIDPGIGFGKTVKHNLQLLNQLDRFVKIGFPVLVGVSRKSFLGKILGSESEPLPAEERLEGGLAAQVLAQIKGARIIRTHDVKETVSAIEIARAILECSDSSALSSR